MSMMKYCTYPTLDQVNEANRMDICGWYRFLPSALTDEQRLVTDRILERFREFGGFTPEISKAIGLGD